MYRAIKTLLHLKFATNVLLQLAYTESSCQADCFSEASVIAARSVLRVSVDASLRSV